MTVINETMARQAFPNGDPIGQEVLTGMLQRKASGCGAPQCLSKMRVGLYFWHRHMRVSPS